MLSLSQAPAPLPHPLTETELRALVTKAVETGAVRETFHSERDRAYRNASMEDILHGLQRPDWTLVKHDYDSKHRNWVYRIRTVDIEDDALTLTVAPDPMNETVLVITKF